MANEKGWRRLGDMCPHCGDEAEVFTACDSGEACDDEDARCISCRCPGCVTVDDDGDVTTASVRWHDDPDCDCDWCAMSAMITSADKRRAAAESDAQSLREALKSVIPLAAMWAEGYARDVLGKSLTESIDPFTWKASHAEVIESARQALTPTPEPTP